MKFRSVKGESPAVSFREALFNGQAPDGSLYVPELLPKLSPGFVSSLREKTYQEIAFEMLSLFLDEIPSPDLKRIIEKSFTFPIPLVHLEDNLYLLELFHGPTLAFKDVGARFMANILSYFLQKDEREITILVATSGDTGSAVAHGFYNVPNINVYVLYPSGKISRLQEQQMTTLGGNIHAIEVEGTFDDCQRLVKQSLADVELVTAKNLTTANSINLGRLLPQCTYYAWAVAQLQNQFTQTEKPVVVVPSGNFGNLTAAVYAREMGIPIQRFIAAMNKNDVVGCYLWTGDFIPRTSIRTYSNAMDVGNPSNFARLQDVYHYQTDNMKSEIEPFSITDEKTLQEIQATYERSGIILDPHTSVGVYSARQMKSKWTINTPMVVASTAHAAKFLEVVKKAIGIEIPLPEVLRSSLKKEKKSTRISTKYEDWKNLLIK
ncbi:MAG: threonine synthase [Ignavibacteriae bacterium]|nr:threonine synthase [Ignavibacteriota bacterium]